MIPISLFSILFSLFNVWVLIYFTLPKIPAETRDDILYFTVEIRAQKLCLR